MTSNCSDRCYDLVDTHATKLFHTTLISQVALILGYSAITFVRVSTLDSFSENMKTEVLKLSILTMLSAYSIFSYWHSLKKENHFQLLSFIIITLLTNLNCAYSLIYAFQENSTEEVLGHFSLVCGICFIIAEVFFCIISYYNWKVFGWRNYRRIGASAEKVQVYTSRQSFKYLSMTNGVISLVTLLAFFFFLSTEVLVISEEDFLKEPLLSSATATLIALAAMNIVLGIQSVNRRSKVLAALFTLIMLVLEVYQIGLLYLTSKNLYNNYKDWVEFDTMMVMLISMASLQTLLCGFIFFYLYRCVKHFKHDSKDLLMETMMHSPKLTSTEFAYTYLSQE